MYWNNPTIATTVALGPDVVVESQHQGEHCLFYDPHMHESQIERLVTLTDTCELANQWLGKFDQISEPGDVDKVANIVRINQFVHSLQTQGNLKPALLHYTGVLPMSSGTGGSRLMAMERIPTMTTIPCFVSTHHKYKSEFQHLQEIKTLSEFAERCHADQHTQFFFRLTDSQAPYGIDWYEAALSHTTVPGNAQCLEWLSAYVAAQPADFEFTPEWFDQDIDWTTWGHH